MTKVLGFAQPEDTSVFDLLELSPPSIRIRPVISGELFNWLIRVSQGWRIYDIRRIAVDLNVQRERVTHDGHSRAAIEVIDKAHRYAFATSVSISWWGGPSGSRHFRSNLSHWLLDSIMREARLRTEAGPNGQEKTKAFEAQIRAVI